MKNFLIKISTTFFVAGITSAIVFVSCNDSENKKLIVGDWTAVEWLRSDTLPGYSTENVSFTFKVDKTYTYTYRNYSEQGKYFISNNQLHTTPEGGITMMVKIVKLEGDTLIFDMNRGGQSEKLTLIRK